MRIQTALFPIMGKYTHGNNYAKPKRCLKPSKCMSSMEIGWGGRDLPPNYNDQRRLASDNLLLVEGDRDRFQLAHELELNGPYLVSCVESGQFVNDDKAEHRNMYLKRASQPSVCALEIGGEKTDKIIQHATAI